ncbi:MAG: hypothetical protein H0W76_17145 [Pyrinomonadaceae bacterium]|nr:hypothetical protein [Pyrinomonadaceae bacterium]
MEYETNKSGDREKRWLIPIAALITFLFTFISAFLLMNLSALYRPEDTTADDVGTIEDGFCRVAVDAPSPYLRCGSPVKLFEKLRQNIIATAGFDFLAKCGDIKRHKKAKYSKQGVANDSKHKRGLAFDYNQEDARVLIVREDIAGITYWRTYLRCEKQDGTCGVKADIDTDNAGRVSAYLFDFTSAAEGLGWERIPAHEGWQYSWKKKEFWHYQLKNSLLDETEDFTDAEPDRMQKAKTSEVAIPLQIMKKLLGFR